MFKKTGDLLKFNLAQGRDILQYNNEITQIEEKNLPLIERGSIIENLGGLFKSNLNQGKQMLDYNSQETEDLKPDLSLIENGSIVESLGNMNLNASDKLQIEGLSNIENDYNQLLAQYSQTYKQFSEELLQSTQNLDPIKQYLGKNVRTSSGEIVYVNNFGYYNYYSPTAWNSGSPVGCPSGFEQLNGDLPSQLQQGPVMVPGQPCGLAGKVIKNNDTQEKAWVDIKGYKHIFTSTLSNDCSEQDIIGISNSDYSLIPTGDTMKSTDYCIAMNVNPSLYSKLQRLNAEIKIKANQLVSQMNSLNLSNTQAQNSLNNRRNSLMKQANQVSDINKRVVYNNRMLMKDSGEADDASLRMTSNWYIYLAWIFVAILVISLAMANTSGIGGKSVSGVAYVIVALGILLFLIFLYKKISSITIQMN